MRQAGGFWPKTRPAARRGRGPVRGIKCSLNPNERAKNIPLNSKGAPVGKGRPGKMDFLTEQGRRRNVLQKAYQIGGGSNNLAMILP